MKHENDRLDAVKESFRQWRCTRIKKGPIPEDLWQAAAKLWDSYSLCKIAKELKLDYNQLKHRIRQRSPQPQSFQLPQSQPCQFIEVHIDRIKIASNGAIGPCVPSLHVVETGRKETILSYRGKGVTAEDVAFIRSLIEEHPGDSRRKLSSRLCRAWNWVQPTESFAIWCAAPSCSNSRERAISHFPPRNSSLPIPLLSGKDPRRLQPIKPPWRQLYPGSRSCSLSRCAEAPWRLSLTVR